METKGYVVMKKTRHYTGGVGRGNKVYPTVEEALAVAVELTQTNPVGFEVLPYKPVAGQTYEPPPYHVEFISHRGMIAVAATMEGYKRAIADKERNPMERFNVVELVTHGNVRASLIWNNGRWA